MMRLAFRNLWRRKRRTLITAGSIGFGLWLSVLTVGTRESTYQRLVKTSAQGGFGTMTLVPKDFSPSRAQLLSLDPAAPNAARLQELAPGLLAVPRKVGEAVVQSTSRNSGAGWMAVDPMLESTKTSIFCQGLISGHCDRTWQKGAMIGRVLAERLKLRVGDQMVYTIQDAAAQSLSLMSEVQGIFQTGSEELDGHFFMLPLAELQAQLPEASRALSFIALFIDDAHQVAAEVKRLQAVLGDSARLLSWRETQPDLDGFIAADQVMYTAMLIFVGLIIASGVATCMIMNVIERRRELGTLLALGMKPWQLIQLLLAEALCLGVLGLVMGLIAVAPFYLYLHLHGIDLSFLVGQSLSVGGVTQTDLVLRCTLGPWQLLIMAVGLIAASLVAALVPAVMAAFTLPVKVLRES